MKIQTLKLKNFRCFEDFDIDFNTGDGNHGGLTVLVAKNGDGKTAILDAVDIALGMFFRKMPNMKGKTFRLADRRNIDDLKAMDAYGYLYEEALFFDEETGRQYPVKRECFLGKDRRGHTTVKDGKALESLADDILSTQIYHKKAILPVLVHYRDCRLWDQEYEEDDNNRNLLCQDRVNGYLKARNEDGFENFYQWYVALWFNLNILRVKKAYDRPSFDPDALEHYETLHKVIVKALKTVLTETGWDDLEYDIDSRKLYVINSRTKAKANINDLSAGNRIVLGVVGDMAYRCFTLNPQAGMNVLEKTSGIVMIDEIELHLHPAWQQRILPVLQKIFPKIQFIVTTHSPQVVSSIPKECVRIIDNGTIRPLYCQTQGVDSQNILTEIFGTFPAPQEDEQVIKLNEYARLVATDEAETSEARRLYRELSEHFGSSYQPLVRIELHRKILARKREGGMPNA